VILIDNLMAVQKITEYGVRWTGGDGDPVITECTTLNGAVRYAEKVNGCLMERITYVTEWEPYFGEPDTG
jgi:hypothetical protein